MKKSISALITALAVVLLAGCPSGGGVKGTVLNVYGPEETAATMQGCGKGGWSLSIDTNGTEAGIKRVCLAPNQRTKYKVGDPYP